MKITGNATDSDDAGETALIDQAAEGNSQAFLELIGHHHEALKPMVYRIVSDAASVDDVMQDIYIKAFRGLPRFNRQSSFRTWLFRIAYNAAVDSLRRTNKVVPIHTPEPGTSAANDYDQSTQRHDLSAALMKLPPDQRAAVLLVDAEGFDYASAAEILGIRRGTIASRLVHARRSLRAALGDYLEETK